MSKEAMKRRLNNAKHKEGVMFYASMPPNTMTIEQPAQQEPVAHINSNGVVHATGYPWGDKEVLRPLVYGDTTPQPPAPAQPLTDDKYEAIVEDLADWGRYVEVDTAHQSLEKHVRQVLAAHGITKGNT